MLPQQFWDVKWVASFFLKIIITFCRQLLVHNEEICFRNTGYAQNISGTRSGKVIHCEMRDYDKQRQADCVY